MASTFGQLYQKTYNFLCGQHPHQYPWHFQWLAVKDLKKTIQMSLSNVQAGQKILDVGSGTNPYRYMLAEGVNYTSLDVEGGAGKPDITIRPGEKWPVEDNAFDAILCNQVIEHVRDLDFVLSEIFRVLKPGGTLILSIPFLYPLHGAPHDYRRLSSYGMEQILEKSCQEVKIHCIGGIGTVVSIMLLNWIEESLNLTKTGRYLKAIFMVGWIPFCFLVNMAGMILNALDKTSSYSLDIFAIARKADE